MRFVVNVRHHVQKRPVLFGPVHALLHDVVELEHTQLAESTADLLKFRKADWPHSSRSFAPGHQRGDW